MESITFAEDNSVLFDHGVYFLERVSKTPPERNPEEGDIEEGAISTE